MWGSTAKMAHKIVEGITDEGVSVELFDAAQSDRSDIIYEMFDAKGYVIGSSNHDSGILPSIGSLLEFLKGLKPRNRNGAAFGSYGWSGLAAKQLETFLKDAGIEQKVPTLAIQYAPDEEGLRRCYEFGREFARAVKASGQ